MARTQRRQATPDRPAELYQAHIDEAATERAAARTDAARELHDRAWAAHFTALNTHRQVARNAALAARFRSDAGWHESRRPSRREWVTHPRTGARIPAHEYLREVAAEYDAAAAFAAERAPLHHAAGVQHSTEARKVDAAAPDPVDVAAALVKPDSEPSKRGGKRDDAVAQS
jgi:hypothetical protein